jgi:hypothetical protein
MDHRASPLSATARVFAKAGPPVGAARDERAPGSRPVGPQIHPNATQNCQAAGRDELAVGQADLRAGSRHRTRVEPAIAHRGKIMTIAWQLWLHNKLSHGCQAIALFLVVSVGG